jgi:SAM-dependent methyltransferase
MIRRFLGGIADCLLKIQNFILPITTWMPRFYWVRSLIDWGASHTLDASCGTGELTVWMRKRGLHVSGTNISEHEVEVSRRVATSANLQIDFRVGDLSGRTPFEDGAFDQIVSLDTVVHIPDDDAVFREFHRLLAPEGRLLLSLASIAPSGRGRLFRGEGIVRFLTPRFLYSDNTWEGESWLRLTAAQQQARFFQHRFYTIEDLENQVAERFSVVGYVYALHRFTCLATDLVFGIRFFKFFEPSLFFLAARIDRLFYSRHRPGYLLFVILQKK